MRTCAGVLCPNPAKSATYVICLHVINFVIAGNAWVCYAPVVCISDDVMRKLNIYASIRERSSWNM